MAIAEPTMHKWTSAPSTWIAPAARIAQKGLDFVILTWLFVHPMKSTIIVVIRSGDSVVVAADSRRTTATGQLVNDSTCKIKPIGNDLFVASAGATRSLELINSKMVSRPLADSDTIAEALERHLIPFLRMMSQEILSHLDPTAVQYSKWAKGASLLSFVVVGKTRTNHIGWAMRDFSIWSSLSPGEGGRDDAIRNSCPGNCPTPQIILSGSHAEALRRAPDLLLRKFPTEVAQELVGIQMHADPANVGGQISVLAVDRTGHKWIKSGACATE